MVFPNPSTALASVLIGDDLLIDAPTAILNNNGVKPKIYAPSAFSLGSSVTHLDDATYPAGDTNSLMSHSIGTAEAIHSPGPIVMGLFQDLGWPLCTAASIEDELALINAQNRPKSYER